MSTPIGIADKCCVKLNNEYYYLWEFSVVSRETETLEMTAQHNTRFLLIKL